jgi:hypothetical protein
MAFVSRPYGRARARRCLWRLHGTDGDGDIMALDDMCGTIPCTLQRLLGHDRLTTTEIYLNLSPEEVVREFREKR